jgi:hypothetical protein
MHVKRDSDHPYHKYAKTMGLSEFIADPVTLPLVYNFQSRYLAAQLTGFDCRFRLPREASTRGQLAVTWEAMSFGMSDDDIRSRALASLEKLDFVGFVEDFETSIRQLAQLLGAEDWCIGRLNESTNTSDINDVTTTTREVILDLTRIDRELYRVARSKYGY